jgi:DNA-binding beta-propeller fold protein YncE
MRRPLCLVTALWLAGCHAPPQSAITWSLAMYDEGRVISAPIDVAAQPVPERSRPAATPSPSGGRGNHGGGSSGPPPIGDVDLTVQTGDSYGVSGFAGEAAGGLAVGADPLSARFGAIAGLALAPDGTVYAVDPVHHQVRAIRPDGAAVVAGDVGGQPGYFGDNVPAVGTRLNGPTGLARDAVTGALFVADTGNGRVRVFTPGGRIYTFAGGGTNPADGTAATSAVLGQPFGVALDTRGRLYVSDRSNGKIRRVDEAGKIATLATLTGEAVGAIALQAAGDVVWVAQGAKVFAVRPGQTPALDVAPVYEGAADSLVTALASDQAGSLFVMTTSVAPFGRAATQLWRVPVGVTGRPAARIAGLAEAGAAPADYVVPPGGVADATTQRLAGASHTGLAIDLFHAADPEVPSGTLYQANTYDDGTARWGQVNRIIPTP